MADGSNALGQVLAAGGGARVCVWLFRGIPSNLPGDLRPSRRMGPRMASGKPRMAHGGGARRRVAVGLLPRAREAPDPVRLPLGRPAQEAVHGAALLPLHLDRSAEGGTLGRPRGQQDRRLLTAADLDPLRHPHRPPQVPRGIGGLRQGVVESLPHVRLGNHFVSGAGGSREGESPEGDELWNPARLLHHPDIGTARHLVLRYESDVLIRVQTLEGEKVEIIAELHNEHDEDVYKDWDDQIAHWKATLTDIQKVITRYRLR